MSPVDILTLSAFGTLVLLGLGWLVVADMARQRPRRQVRERLKTAGGVNQSASRARIMSELQRAQNEARRRRQRAALGGVGYYLNRLDTVWGRGGARRLTLAVAALEGLGILLLLLGMVPMSGATAFGLVLGVPLMLALVAYRWLVARFRRRFMKLLPDALDMIVRASRAGIPTTQSIRNVGQQFDDPLGAEFRRMGDSLLLGNDLQDVLDEAVLRVEISDFTFFAVCLSLQRESGGSVTEALENLSGVIRARRDVALKARALTAEGRISGLILTLLPFIVFALLYAVNKPYTEVLITTEAGRLILTVAAGMLVAGTVAMRRLTRMEV